jgi:hypothetical protein
MTIFVLFHGAGFRAVWINGSGHDFLKSGHLAVSAVTLELHDEGRKPDRSPVSPFDVLLHG